MTASGNLEQPNPYKELRKELVRIHNELSKNLMYVDNILKKLQEETE